jgi:hypothetical protein
VANFRADDEMLASEHAIIFKQHIWLTNTTKVSFQWCTIWDISGATGGILLRFKLDWKLDILGFPTKYDRSIKSSKRERKTCLKSYLIKSF